MTVRSFPFFEARRWLESRTLATAFRIGFSAPVLRASALKAAPLRTMEVVTSSGAGVLLRDPRDGKTKFQRGSALISFRKPRVSAAPPVITAIKRKEG